LWIHVKPEECAERHFWQEWRMTLSGISSGKTVDQIITSISSNVRKKSDQIREILDQEISQSAAFRLQICLKLIKNLDDEIEKLWKNNFCFLSLNLSFTLPR